MKNILKRYIEPFSTEISQSKSRVVEVIAQEKGRKRDFFGFLSSGPVDFKEITVSEDKISIKIKPKLTNPYRGMGEIRMRLQSGKTNAETKMDGEIIPYNSLYLFTVYMVTGFLVIWTALVFAVTSGKHTFIMVAIAWTLFPSVLYLMLFWNRSMLREYKDFFLVNLETNKKSFHKQNM